MYRNELFALECLRRYKREGLVVDDRNGVFAHCPLPRGMGDTGVYLLHNDHQQQGILQSEDVGRKCFYEHDALRFLKESAFGPQLFELWELYEKWCGNKGKSMYRDPDSGEVRLLTPEEASQAGWVHVNAGKKLCRNPLTEERRWMTPEVAEELGWVGNSAGRAPSSCADAPGKSTYRDPDTGECRRMTPGEAELEGWIHVCYGTSTYLNPETREVQVMSAEEARNMGWVGVNSGKTTYRCPETGECRLMTAIEAEESGWVHANKGRKHKTVQCPHCGKVGGLSGMKARHFNNCRALKAEG